MSKVENAVQWAINIANDNSHGYDQASRWGVDYDCSSLVISAFEQAGIPVKSRGATYTGNMMTAFLQCGFSKVTDGSLKRGDVLLNVKNHTALYIGNSQMVEAGGNERGGITGGQPGDQTGNEIRVRSYYNFPWDYILRYIEDVSVDKENSTTNTTTESESYHSPTQSCTVTIPVLEKGCKGSSVMALQALLNHSLKTCLDIDGEFGPLTDAALRSYQRSKGLEVDGSCGPITWKSIIG